MTIPVSTVTKTWYLLNMAMAVKDTNIISAETYVDVAWVYEGPVQATSRAVKHPTNVKV